MSVFKFLTASGEEVSGSKLRTDRTYFVHQRVNGFGALRGHNLFPVLRDTSTVPPLEASQWMESSWENLGIAVSGKLCKDLASLEAGGEWRKIEDFMARNGTIWKPIGLFFEGPVNCDASAYETHFVLCTFKESRITGNLYYARFNRCNLWKCSFEGSKWYHSDFSQCCIKNSHAFGTRFMIDFGRNLSGTQLNLAYAVAPWRMSESHIREITASKEHFNASAKVKDGHGLAPAVTVADFLSGQTPPKPAPWDEPGHLLAFYVRNNTEPALGKTVNGMTKGEGAEGEGISICPVTGFPIWTSDVDLVKIEERSFNDLTVVPAHNRTGLEVLTITAADCECRDDDDEDDESDDDDGEGPVYEPSTGRINYIEARVWPGLSWSYCEVSGVYGRRQYMSDNREGGLAFNELRRRRLIREHGAQFDCLKFYNVPGEPAEPNSTCPFTGFELEVERKSRKYPMDKTLSYILKDDMFMTKHDGSLEDGYEIVSQPFSYGWWLQNRDTKIKAMLEFLSKHDIISHDSGRAGLHIHMSRPAFSNLTVKRDNGKLYTGSLHLARFNRMIYDNPRWAIWMSRRHSHNPNYAKVEVTRTNRVLKQVVGHQNAYDRYVAINLTNRNTVEMRMFRGTLNFKSFCYSIEFMYALWEYTQNTTAVCTVPDFANWVSRTFLGWDKSGPLLKYPYLNGLFKNKADELAKVLANKKEFTFRDEGYVIPAEKLAKMKKAGVEVEA